MVEEARKIFCIGFHKTGTSSLAAALKELGFRVTGPNGIRDPDIANNYWSMVERLVPQYDAFQDNPWPVLYRELDVRYPGSRFILTIRETEAWLQSQLRHFGSRSTPMRAWIYGAGCPEGHESIYRDRYEQHNRDVLAYFDGRQKDLLVMDMAGGDGWVKLCDFLGLPRRSDPFPHENREQVGGKKDLQSWSRRLASRFRW